jgi:ADP-ribosylglycohydrolase
MSSAAFSLESQLRAALLGLAVGDALGVPVEFQRRDARRLDPVVDMRAYGTHHQPAGTWSDDASLTFCLAEAIADGFTLRRLAENCCRWYYENFWTPHGTVFDIGITTREALHKLKTIPEATPLAGGTDEYSNGNGALMRILPLAFYETDALLSTRFLLISDVSAVTHWHVRSAVACWLYLEAAWLACTTAKPPLHRSGWPCWPAEPISKTSASAWPRPSPPFGTSKMGFRKTRQKQKALQRVAEEPLRSGRDSNPRPPP